MIQLQLHSHVVAVCSHHMVEPCTRLTHHRPNVTVTPGPTETREGQGLQEESFHLYMFTAFFFSSFFCLNKSVCLNQMCTNLFKCFTSYITSHYIKKMLPVNSFKHEPKKNKVFRAMCVCSNGFKKCMSTALTLTSVNRPSLSYSPHSLLSNIMLFPESALPNHLVYTQWTFISVPFTSTILHSRFFFY